MIEIDDKIHSVTHFMVEACLHIFSIVAVIGAIVLFFAPFSFLSAEKFIGIGSVLLGCLVIYGVIALLKCLSVFIHKKYEAKKSTQMRNEILIGLGGIAICGIVPRILVFFEESVLYFFFHSAGLFCVISIALYHLFIYECDKYYESNSNANSNANGKLLVLHIVVLMVGIKLVLTFFDFNRAMDIICYQVYFGIVCVPNTIDLYEILSGNRKLKNVDGEEEPVGNTDIVRREPVIVAPKAEQVTSSECGTDKNQGPQMAPTHPKIDCKVCRVEYSDTRTPRILRECGHTICEICVDTLLIHNNLHFLLCPFCKVATAVNGPASMLQKSYGILEIINDLKN